jgi:hypothetical protein
MTPRTLYVSSIRLAAVLTAVSLSREFVRQTLKHWQLEEQIDSAELIASELVTNAVKMSGTSRSGTLVTTRPSSPSSTSTPKAAGASFLSRPSANAGTSTGPGMGARPSGPSWH